MHQYLIKRNLLIASVPLALIVGPQSIFSIDNNIIKTKTEKTGHPLSSDNSRRPPYLHGQDSVKTSYWYHRKPLSSQDFIA